MKIIEFERKGWFFLREENNFYIDVNCSHSFVGFGMLIKLDNPEITEYQNIGRIYLNCLANDIQNFALSKYKERNILESDIYRIVHETIIKFLESNQNI